MDWLNYHHLLYFWVVAREGSLARASSELRLSQSAISGQIKALEKSLGETLFVKSGRRLMLSETGRMVYRYANEIFNLGKELQDTLKDRPRGRPLQVHVGVADVVPKLVVRHLLEPAFGLPVPVRLCCREDKSDRLLAELAMHELDVILTDAPASTHIRVKAFNHLMEECDTTILAHPDVAARHAAEFPSSMNHAPMLLPSDNTALRRSLDHWFDENDIRPRIVGEFDDNALLNVFGQIGLGLFPAPSLIADEVMQELRVDAVGRLPDVRQRFYAITVQRRMVHPVAAAICHEAHDVLSPGSET